MGRQTEDRLADNLTRAVRLYLELDVGNAPSLVLATQRGIIRGCAIALLSWCNPMYHGSAVMVAEVERIFVRRVMEERDVVR